MFFIRVMNPGFFSSTAVSPLPLYIANSAGGYSFTLKAVTRTVSRRMPPPM